MELRTKAQSLYRLSKASREQLHKLSESFIIEHKMKLTLFQKGMLIMIIGTLINFYISIIF
jgi:hypothetical protein